MSNRTTNIKSKRFTRIFKEKGYGQRFFTDAKAPGKIAIADNSGPTPDQTDDGVLYVDPTRPLRPYASAENRFYVNLGVVNPDGEKFGAGCQVEGALFLLGRPELEGLTVELDDQLTALQALLQTAPQSPTVDIRCPKCGNDDLSQMRFVEDLTSYRQLHGVDSEGVLVVNDAEYDTDDGDNGRLRCFKDGCFHDFELPEQIDYRNSLGEPQCPKCGEAGYSDPEECSFCQDQEEVA